MKKWVSTLAICMTTALLAGCQSSQGTTVSVDSVGNITGLGNVGASDKFAGMVVSEDEVNIEKTSGLSVKEVKVSEGDVVQEGQILFVYDTDSLELTLEKQELELEQLQATITSKTKENTQLNKDAKGTSGSTKLEYTIQIQSNEADIKEAEYNIKLKEKEIQATKESLEDVNVTSPITGTVKSISSDDSDSSTSDEDSDSGSDSSDAFIVLTKSDSFEIKGTINEVSARTLEEGMTLLIRSRTDATQTWTGTLDRIDWEKADTSSSSSSYYSSSEDTMTTSSKYPFYVTLDSQDGLILGQHVYIETDLSGDGTAAGAQFSLPSYYILDADTDSPYVWAESSGGKLEKRKVTLGTYDEDADEYPIMSGLSLTDYIAFPSDECQAGVTTQHVDSFDEEDGDTDYTAVEDDTEDVLKYDEETYDTYDDEDETYYEEDGAGDVIYDEDEVISGESIDSEAE